MTPLTHVSRARSFLGSAPLVWDNHACFPLRCDDAYLEHLHLYRDAGVTLVSVNVGFGDMSWAQHVELLSYFRAWIAGRPEHFSLVSSAADVMRCREEQRLGVVFDVEGMQCVAHRPGLVQAFYELGVRWMLIAYNRNNDLGGGCLDKDEGLTQAGRDVIDAMERVGMVLCLSHTGSRTALDALGHARNPVIFSHSNPAGHTKHERNISDKTMRACASKGGVIGLSGVGPFLGEPENMVATLVDQIRYVLDLVGAPYVGLGLDHVLDTAELSELIAANPTLFPANAANRPVRTLGPACIGEIAESLLGDNLSEEEVRGILGENWLRVARAVWH